MTDSELQGIIRNSKNKDKVKLESGNVGMVNNRRGNPATLLRTPEQQKAKGKTYHRADRAERYMRVISICKALTEGSSRRAAQERFCAEWGIQAEAYRRYEMKAFELVKESTQEYVNALRDIILQRYDDIYKRSIENHDHTNGLKALKQLCELTGIDAPTQSEITVNTTADFEF